MLDGNGKFNSMNVQPNNQQQQGQQNQNQGNCNTNNASLNTAGTPANMNMCNSNNANNTTPAQSPSPRAQAPTYPPPPPPPMLPVSLPTSVAIPNPSLHESQVFSPYSPFFNPHPPHAPPPQPQHGPHSGTHATPTAAQMHHLKMSSSPPGGLGNMMDSRDSPPLPHPPTMLHPALLAAAHHGGSPDYSAHLRAAMDAQDRNSDCNSADMQFDGMQPTISFLKQQMIKNESLSPLHSSTLTPMHLRKAKLMFFWVRYPSSAVLKMYFPDIKFNKNNTAQLVKWFSNFRACHKRLCSNQHSSPGLATEQPSAQMSFTHEDIPEDSWSLKINPRRCQ
ncbi:homeobox protein prospero-like [Teleopsis dalmanni]|uniref:homeobox protein prospero-like n=1 Tax=Teleopsis dalmanni TaxID=139649 RepID=UPI0018CD651A|nr:homeobox protein prospero-like [Teleopsis dalmanni]